MSASPNIIPLSLLQVYRYLNDCEIRARNDAASGNEDYVDFFVLFHPYRIRSTYLKLSGRKDDLFTVNAAFHSKKNPSTEVVLRLQQNIKLLSLEGEETPMTAEKEKPNASVDAESDSGYVLAVKWRHVLDIAKSMMVEGSRRTSLPMDIEWYPRVTLPNTIGRNFDRVAAAVDPILEQYEESYRDTARWATASIPIPVRRIIILGLNPVLDKARYVYDRLNLENLQSHHAACALVKATVQQQAAPAPLEVIIQVSSKEFSFAEDRLRHYLLRQKDSVRIESFRLVEDIAAVDSIDNYSLVISFRPEFPVRNILADLVPRYTQPSAIICSPISIALDRDQLPWSMDVDEADPILPHVQRLAKQYSLRSTICFPDLPPLERYDRPAQLVPHSFGEAFRNLETCGPFFNRRAITNLSYEIVKDKPFILNNKRLNIYGENTQMSAQRRRPLASWGTFEKRAKWRSYQEVARAGWDGTWRTDTPWPKVLFSRNTFLPLDLDWVHTVDLSPIEDCDDTWRTLTDYGSINGYLSLPTGKQLRKIFTSPNFPIIRADKIACLGFGLIHQEPELYRFEEGCLSKNVAMKFFLADDVMRLLHPAGLYVFLDTPPGFRSANEKYLRHFVIGKRTGEDTIVICDETEIFPVLNCSTIVISRRPNFCLRQVIADIILEDPKNSPLIVICDTVDHHDRRYDDQGSLDPISPRVQKAFADNEIYASFPLVYEGQEDAFLGGMTMYVRTDLLGYSGKPVIHIV